MTNFKYHKEDEIAAILETEGYEELSPQMEIETDEGSVIYWDAIFAKTAFEVRTEIINGGKTLNIQDRPQHSEELLEVVNIKI